MVVAAVLSCFQLTHDPSGWTVEVRVTSVTAGILAAARLPSVLSLIALGGGKLTTPAGGFETSGLLSAVGALSPEAQRETLAPLVAAFDTPEGQQVAARVRPDPPDRAPGPDRTYRMTLVLTRARNLGRQAAVDRQRFADWLAGQRRTAGEAIRAELSKPDMWLQRGTDRYRLAQRLLSALA